MQYYGAGGSEQHRILGKDKSKEVEERDDLYIDIGSAAPSSETAHVEPPSIMGILFNMLANVLLVFLPALFSFYEVKPQEHQLVIFFGSLVKVAKTPGNVASAGRAICP